MKIVRYSSFVQIFGRDGSVGEVGSIMVNDDEIPQLIASLKNAQQGVQSDLACTCGKNLIGEVENEPCPIAWHNSPNR